MKRVLGFIPVVIVVELILFLTLQSIQETVFLSESFRRWLISLCGRFGFYEAGKWLDSSIIIRRIGHVIEYFVLGIAAAISLKRKRYALLFCLCISVADQIIKIYVPGRHFDWMDLMFDAMGYVIGLSVVWIAKQIIFAKRRSASSC